MTFTKQEGRNSFSHTSVLNCEFKYVRAHCDMQKKDVPSAAPVWHTGNALLLK